MPINFPSNPSQDQTYTFNNKTWRFTGTTWVRSSAGAGAGAGNGYTGSTGSIGFTGSAGSAGTTGYTGSVGSFSGTTSQAIITSNTQAATSTATGALQVAGGAGIAGNLHVGGTLVVTGNILPSSNNTISIGSPDSRFANIWVSANTVHIGDTSLSSGDGGDLQVSAAGAPAVSIIGPKISGLDYPSDDLAANPAGGEAVVINGSGFKNGAAVYLDGAVVGVVSVVSGSQISFITPAKVAGSYTLNVVNSDGGTAIFVPGIQYSGMPTWSTAAGSLGTMSETQSFNYNLSATSDSAINYGLTAGSLPNGATLYSGNGAIRGTANLVNSSTTYSFTVDATDAENQNTGRSFSVTVNPDVITWNSPANNTTISQYETLGVSQTLSASSGLGKGITYTANVLPSNLSISGNTITGNLTLAAASTTSLITATSSETNKTATRTLQFTVNPDVVSWTTPSTAVVSVTGIAGEDSYSLALSAASYLNYSISYSANVLPANISLSSGTISGTFTTIANTSSLITATSATTNRSSTRVINFTVTGPPVGQVAYTSAGTYTWTAPAGVRRVCVVCVGGGGGGQWGFGYNGWYLGPGGGGGLAWANSITVVPGTSYTVVVGAAGTRDTGSNVNNATNGGDSYFISNTAVVGKGGICGGEVAGGAGGTYTIGAGYTGGGGNGGTGGTGWDFRAGGAGGAGGYTGNGGNGGVYGSGYAGAGGGGGGGGGNDYGNSGGGAGGGGVGILGQGANGAAGGAPSSGNSGGGGGSGGSQGGHASANGGARGGDGGNYGGGGGGTAYNYGNELAGNGGVGAVRIIWGAGRNFPSTNTGDL